jgi:2,4-dienoyl-CoA reductase-like NADH-dependent reductase (Old Yellow Enzyme family)
MTPPVSEIEGERMRGLFDRTDINGMVLSNRLVRSATWEGLATEEGAPTPTLVNLMANLAQGGVGMIITGHAYVRQDGKHSPRQLGIHTDELVPYLKSMTGSVHERGGKILAQLGFGGAYLSRARVRNMSVQEMQAVAEAFGQAAMRARKAAFDGVQIFAAHGFFLSQLLCPRYNDRSDSYGGSIENRARALMEVLHSVRAGVGRDYPVLAKLNCRDLIEGGLSLEDSIRVGLMLEEGGIDAIELSGGVLNIAGLMEQRTEANEREAYFLDEARAFKERIRVPLILVGGIRSHEVARWLVDAGIADYVSMCRPFIREPELANRWKEGSPGKAACISCNNCVERVKRGDGLSCVPLDPVVPETFFIELSETVPASPPHPVGTSYRVALGLEAWGPTYVPVIKVQMVRDGSVLDDAPSFPLGTMDYHEVGQAVARLLEKHPRVPGGK